MKSIDTKQVVGYIKSLGFNVFYGFVEYPFSITVRWDKDNGDLKDFMRVAKAEGVRLIIIDWLNLDDEMIDVRTLETDVIQNLDERERIDRRNDAMEAYRKNVGETASISVSWVKDSVRYFYAEATDWWTGLGEIFDEIDEEIGEGREERAGF
ncbi:MAG: hypothetical protein OK474_02570 [Thaumarchaeota archaeon]|nr:hypothetical protein [Nitrososphaerota archaeon]